MCGFNHLKVLVVLRLKKSGKETSRAYQKFKEAHGTHDIEDKQDDHLKSEMIAQQQIANNNYAKELEIEENNSKLAI